MSSIRSFFGLSSLLKAGCRFYRLRNRRFLSEQMAIEVRCKMRRISCEELHFPENTSTSPQMPDPTTQSNYLSIHSKSVEFDWNIDWNKQRLVGSATHHLIITEDGVDKVIFDTSFLDIQKVLIDGDELKFNLGEHHPVMGQALTIQLPKHSLTKDKEITLKIEYSTTEDCTALQWLDKDQTAGGKFDYLFSQCQPIYARSIAPIQDTPSVKITWTATVASILPVVMSAIRISPPSSGPLHDGKQVGKDTVTYKYTQPVPIPSYLLAIASGNLQFKAFEPPEGAKWSSGVWTEPEMMDAAFQEFSYDTPRFVSEAEKILIPYKFGVYDILTLPFSFPYGGMENPCLTFLTPTLLSGDRALVDVIAHELTHSYFGNGVTQKDASSFWLNEGWTTYFERVLQHVIHGPAARDFSFIIGKKALDDSLKQYEERPKYQRLVIDFNFGEDPDDAYSSIPYEKGANFLLYLERLLGGLEVFLRYARDYVSTFIGKSIDTQDWKNHLYGYFEKYDKEKVKLLDTVDWNAWFYGEGLKLPVENQFDSTLAQRAYKLADDWDASRDKPVEQLSFTATDLDGWNTNQIIVFLEKLDTLPALPPSHVHHLGTLYSFTSTRAHNAELGLRWFELVLVNPDAARDYTSAAATWLIGEGKGDGVKGRMKFCRPVFRLLNRVDGELAKKTFLNNKKKFHPIAQKLIAKDLGIA